MRRGPARAGGRAAGRAGLPGTSAPAGVGRGAGGRLAGGGPRPVQRPGQPGLCDLHLRLHRPAQGRDGRAGRHAQQPVVQGALPGAGRARRDRPDRLAELRHLGLAVPRRAAVRRPGGDRAERHRPRSRSAAGPGARAGRHGAGKRAAAGPGHARRGSRWARRAALAAAHRRGNAAGAGPPVAAPLPGRGPGQRLRPGGMLGRRGVLPGRHGFHRRQLPADRQPHRQQPPVPARRSAATGAGRRGGRAVRRRYRRRSWLCR
ncbi:hypothetical protein D9M68_608690 [compost metagenome]